MVAGEIGGFGLADDTGAAARFYDPLGLAAEGAGNLYVADTQSHTIRKVMVSTGAVTTLAGTADMSGSADGTGAAARFNNPYGMALDGADHLYVADTNNHTVRKVALSSGAVTTVAGTPGVAGGIDGTDAAARFNYPASVVADGIGNLYIADFGSHTIRKVDVNTGTVTTVAGTAGLSGSTDGTGAGARFYAPSGVAADGAGHLYVTDSANHTIRKIDLANASVTTIAGVAGQTGVKLGLPGRLNIPRGIAALPTGEIFVTEERENAILSLR